MFVANRALAARATLRDVYEHGDYVPLQIAGARRDCVFAFARVARRIAASPTAVAITCVPRLVALAGARRRRAADRARRLGRHAIELPAGLAGGTFRDVFTGATVDGVPSTAATSGRLPRGGALRTASRGAPAVPMLYLTIIGGAFIAWLIVALLFTPHIPYHIEADIDATSDHFIHVLESICQTHLEHGNRVEVLTNGDTFYPAMLDAIRGARETGQHGGYIFKKGESAISSSRRCRERARAGVRVTLVIDAIGTFGDLPRSRQAPLERRAAGSPATSG